MPTDGRSWMASERAAISAVMDRLVPPIDDLPGAGTMGLLDEVLAMAERHAPYRRALLGLRAAFGRPVMFLDLDDAARDDALRRFEQAEPAVFAAMLAMVYLAYYGNERVQQRIGWRGGPLQPRGFDLPPFDELVLETTRKRQPLWRRVD
jgi:hypothetical protein